MAHVQDFTIYTSAQLSVVQGVNYGDPLSVNGELYLDDVYRLKTNAQPTRLTLQEEASGRRHRVAAHSAIGAIGAVVHLDSQVTLMSEAGQTFDALIFVEVELGEIKQVYLSAFSALQPDTDYRLIGIDCHVNPHKLAELSDPIFYPVRKSPWLTDANALPKISNQGKRFSPMTSHSRKLHALRSKPNVRRARTVQ